MIEEKTIMSELFAEQKKNINEKWLEEKAIMNELLKEEKDPVSKQALLTNKLEDIFATVFRQVVLTRFEQRLHDERRGRGELTAESINKIWIDTNKSMFGNSVVLTEDYALWWMYIPHFIHSPFYCYAYSFGELLVLSLYSKYLTERESFVPLYIELLTAGGSESPENLLARLGVDIKDPGFWQGGLSILRGMVDQAVGLAEKIDKKI